MVDKYTGIPIERFNQLKANYDEFLERLNDTTKEPVKVFFPLPQNAIDDIKLIREVSANLQQKKEEDVKRAAQAAQEEEEKAKEVTKAENTEENSETEKKE